MTVVPDDDVIIDGIWTQGRQLRTAGGTPVAWISDRAVSGLAWSLLTDRAAESGLQPFLLSGMDGGTERPWDTGEQVTEPADAADTSGGDALRVLERWWTGPTEDEVAGDDDLRAMLAPFGAQFPGLAPSIQEELDPELMRRAIFQYTREARIGLVPARRSSDVLARMGWAGACNSRTASELVIVLRSWEERYGARLLEVGFASIRLLVSRPPQTLKTAQLIAAEHYAFSDEAHNGLHQIDAIAQAVVNNPFWDFWWD